ncbi:transposase [Sinorhizobium meliloti]|uniref:transposase n=1 Tax=Rhizobium meliloti TaxID=382 RepID=UPI00338F2C96
MHAEAAGDPGGNKPSGARALGGGRTSRHRAGVCCRKPRHRCCGLVIDETGSLKQGKTSCGVARQWFGRQDNELPDRCVRSLCVSLAVMPL